MINVLIYPKVFFAPSAYQRSRFQVEDTYPRAMMAESLLLAENVRQNDHWS